ncbi:MAG TPA: erythronate-4-phosphate dehydrogenase, partial [Fibrobacteria bacterium]|nr:erythronate-4-phosphate dehydrogenase [Fibrobacteria bacterium]
MKILVDENIPQGREVFSAYGDVVTFHGRRVTAEDVRKADALLVRSITKVNAALLDGSRVKFVGTATIGVDHVDQAYLKSQGIGFSAAPGCNARSVAEYF